MFASCCLGDEVLLQQLLFDAVVTAPLEAYWNTLMLSDRWPFLKKTSASNPIQTRINQQKQN